MNSKNFRKKTKESQQNGKNIWLKKSLTNL